MRDVICLMGPTASGKTEIAAKLLQVLQVEVISVDSAMVYRGMDIGTAKPDAAFLSHTPHHLIDIRNPDESYSAAEFCDDVDALCARILARGKIPLLVGGTMMYFRAFQTGLSVLPAANPVVREALELEAKNKGWSALYRTLEQVDALTAKRLHPHDTQRIQRALEVYYTTGKPLSLLLAESEKSPSAHYRFINLALFPENRAWLHARIATRFKTMLNMGFLDEVLLLQKQFNLSSDMPSMRSVGYRQALLYQQGSCDLDTFQSRTLAATRQLAKRQLTWLRTWPNAIYFDPENPDCFDAMLELLQLILDNKGT